MPELSREPERLGNPRCLLLAAEVPSEHGPVSKLVRTSALSLTTKCSVSLSCGHTVLYRSCASDPWAGSSLPLILLVREGLSGVHRKHPGPQAVAECDLDIGARRVTSCPTWRSLSLQGVNGNQWGLAGERDNGLSDIGLWSPAHGSQMGSIMPLFS